MFANLLSNLPRLFIVQKKKKKWNYILLLNIDDENSFSVTQFLPYSDRDEHTLADRLVQGYSQNVLRVSTA